MKKYLFVLISGGFLLSTQLANAAENRRVVETAEAMFTTPEGIAFMADPAYDAVKNNMSLTHPGTIRKTLEDAYAAWIADPINAAHAAAGFRAAVGGSRKAAAAAVMADAGTVSRLAKHHKPALIGAMSGHSAPATAAAVVGDGPTLAALATTHHGAIVAEMGVRDAAGAAADIEANGALKHELATTHRDAMITAMTHNPAAITATANTIVSTPSLLKAVLFRWMKGADPSANTNKGNGVWHWINTNYAVYINNFQSYFTHGIRLGNGTSIFPADAPIEGSIPV